MTRELAMIMILIDVTCRIDHCQWPALFPSPSFIETHSISVFFFFEAACRFSPRDKQQESKNHAATLLSTARQNFLQPVRSNLSITN